MNADKHGSGSGEMGDSRKMLCPRCGAEMNHHAMKVDYGVDDPNLIDPVFGGALKEVHCCPHCGHTELRTAQEDRQ